MIYDISKQALSYIEIRDVALLQSVHRSKPFFAKKVGSQDRCSFGIVFLAYFSLCCLAYFTAVKSPCMNIKVKKLSS